MQPVRSFCLLLASVVATAAPDDAPRFDARAAERFARLALECIAREYPNKIAHALNSDRDVAAPRRLTPAFYGCYDWHSAVHGHWLLARLARRFPDASFTARAKAALAVSLTRERIAGEVSYLDAEGRSSFERPYGLAWLLQLAAELREWEGPEPRAWSAAIEPLERAAAKRLAAWLPKLSYPVRSGEHSQSAFALGLILDWARTARDASMEAMAGGRIRSFYLRDHDCPIAYEPSGEDFVSPCLAEADALRRVLPRAEFALWFDRFLPELDIRPAVVTDPTDGKLAHLDGLNLSRAWMIEGIASALPPNHARSAQLRSLAAAHREAGLRSVTGAHYAGGHWLGSFAVYLTTRRGLADGAK